MVHVHHWLQVYSRLHQAFRSTDWVSLVKGMFSLQSGALGGLHHAFGSVIN